jgi:uncharacterized phosphosugar-binding protein
MTPASEYLDQCRGLVAAVEAQLPSIQKAADWFAETIAAGRMVHVFGSGHSRILVEEMWPRYGSFPGFNPIVELSLTFHNLVVGANGQRQAMFLENVSGLAERLTAAGQPPKVLSAGAVVGPARAVELFEAAYDEHGRRLAKLYENLGR